jgi:hypothetical protein
MKALISPNEAPISHIVGWTATVPYEPIFETYQNSCRVAQVEPDNQIFAVEEPLFWANCPNDCVADQWYFNIATNTTSPIVNAPKPAAPDQPIVTGATTA